jgi:sialic acid synthase
MRSLTIGNTRIMDSSEPYIIAELGHNHGGNVVICEKMIEKAKLCGANAVKLQKRTNKMLFTDKLYNSPYENENSYGKTYGEHREALEFNFDQYFTLKGYADYLGIDFFATAFDEEAASFLNKLDVPCFKIASADIVNIPLLHHVAKFGKPMIISTGGCTMKDIERAVDEVYPINNQFALLHCVMEYPNKPENMNLRMITSLRTKFPLTTIGISDHLPSVKMAAPAYILGARIIEKHFTLNRASKGTDHAFSLEPHGMEVMIEDIRAVRSAQGDGIKRILPSEENAIMKMGKSIYSRYQLEKGDKIGRTDLCLKTPRVGLPPYEFYDLLGKTMNKTVPGDYPVTWEDVE